MISIVTLCFFTVLAVNPIAANPLGNVLTLGALGGSDLGGGVGDLLALNALGGRNNGLSNILALDALSGPLGGGPLGGGILGTIGPLGGLGPVRGPIAAGYGGLPPQVLVPQGNYPLGPGSLGQNGAYPCEPTVIVTDGGNGGSSFNSLYELLPLLLLLRC